MKNSFKKLDTFEDMEKSTIKYMLSLLPEERLDILQYIREQCYKIKRAEPMRLNRKIGRKIKIRRNK